MTRKRNPRARHNLITARVDDLSLAEISEIARDAGETKSRITWKAIKAGLPKVKAELNKESA